MSGQEIGQTIPGFKRSRLMHRQHIRIFKEAGEWRAVIIVPLLVFTPPSELECVKAIAHVEKLNAEQAKNT